MKSNTSKILSAESDKALRRFEGCNELRQIETRLHRFNLFDVLRSSDTEIRHSNLLAWLLNPEENHGFKDLFLRNWLVTLFRECERPDSLRIAPAQIEKASLRSVKVWREWHHIDIFIEIKTANQTFAICIENKVHSLQRGGQLSDYREVVEEHYPHPAKHGFIFLTRWEEQPTDSSFVKSNYSQIAKVLENCLRKFKGKLANEPRLFIQHYLQLLEEKFVDTSPIGKLARNIYDKHKKAIDLILEHRPNSSQELSDAIGKIVQDRAKAEELVPLEFENKIVRFIPKSWDTKWNRKRCEVGWCHVFCQIGLWKSYPILQAVIHAKGRREFAKRVESSAVKLEFPRGNNRSTFNKEWYEFFETQGTRMGLDYVPLNEIPTRADQVWKWAKSQIDGAQFEKMKTEIEKLLPRLK